MENSGRVVFSVVLTKTRISEMRSFPMNLSPGRRKGSRCRMAPHKTRYQTTSPGPTFTEIWLGTVRKYLSRRSPSLSKQELQYYLIEFVRRGKVDVVTPRWKDLKARCADFPMKDLWVKLGYQWIQCSVKDERLATNHSQSVATNLASFPVDSSETATVDRPQLLQGIAVHSLNSSAEARWML